MGASNLYLNDLEDKDSLIHRNAMCWDLFVAKHYLTVNTKLLIHMNNAIKNDFDGNPGQDILKMRREQENIVFKEKLFIAKLEKLLRNTL